MSAKTAAKTDLNASYDDVPYESFTYPQTHPAHMKTVGTLFRLSPPELETAEVLEIGCAAGGNLFPQAVAYPKAKFTGIDFSAEQIARAEEEKKALGLKNITFRQEDILKFDLKANKDKFDYIICHGVFSWVPEPVREKVLAVIAACLKKNGLAVVSYNTLPGWHAVRGVREMMLYHTERFPKAQDKIQQARGLLDFLAESVPEANTVYRALIDNERGILKSVNDTYIFHDHLESVNAQFYFHEFMRLATAHQLVYVGDAAYTSMFLQNMTPKAMETLQALNDVVLQEQYMDFVNNRRFRTTILCKDGAKLNRMLENDQIMNYGISNTLTMDGPPDQDLSKPVNFKMPNGSFLTTHDVGTAELFVELTKTGRTPTPARDIAAAVQKRLKSSDPRAAEKLLVQNGLQMVLRGFLNLHSDVPEFTTKISKKPVVYPIARYQAGKELPQVTNALLGGIPTGEIVNIILHSLDGTRTVDDVIDVLAAKVAAGKLNVSRNKQPLTEPKEVRKALVEIMDNTMPKIAQQALLVG